jgi:REP element-mobilizing transposase RayT
MSTTIPLKYGHYYHIFNRGNNGEDLFRSPDNYLHFLRLYETHIEPIADTFAWVLLRNHFHLLVRIKNEDEILPLKKDGSSLNSEITSGSNKNRKQEIQIQSVVGDPDNGLIPKKPTPSRQFSHLFNAYAQYFNKVYDRSGCLFETPFDRIPVDSEKYFRNLIVYIHQNPVHHGFTDDFKDYPWSSYGSILSMKATKLKREKVLGWFNDKGLFIELHKEKINSHSISKFLIE